MNDSGEKKNIFSTMKGSENNWYLTPQQSIAISNLATPPRRLNDLDSNILEEKAYENIEDTSLKLEYRIEDKEKAIQDLNTKIQAADTVGNQQELFSLRIKKQRLEQELRELYKEYSSTDLPSKISSGINGAVTGVRQRKMPVINAIKRFIKRYILAKVSRRFKSLVALGDSLETLENINKNVDELLKMKTPYGETAQNYQKLTDYLYKAHKIRSQINKSVKK
ncbi:hypothetical protein IKP85_03895 [bacterium]|nr:hypothetical protein [bacterium]